MLMWFDALNERGRLKISFLALFVSSTAGFVGLAMFQTVFGGYGSPWWLIAGFFLWPLVMMPAIFGMARLQRRGRTHKQKICTRWERDICSSSRSWGRPLLPF